MYTGSTCVQTKTGAGTGLPKPGAGNLAISSRTQTSVSPIGVPCPAKEPSPARVKAGPERPASVLVDVFLFLVRPPPRVPQGRLHVVVNGGQLQPPRRAASHSAVKDATRNGDVSLEWLFAPTDRYSHQRPMRTHRLSAETRAPLLHCNFLR